MRRSRRRWGTAAPALAGLALCLLIAACGGSNGSTAPPPSSTPTVTLLMASAPGSLDPAAASTPQALEADWLVYTPLLSYAHANGLAGAELMLGLASDLRISTGGRLYSFTLRPGLVYSNGAGVKASDFTRAVERAINLGHGRVAKLVTSRIEGASAYAAGRASAISGIAANDTSGQITIHLTAPYGPFENLLALPAMAPVPSGTPLHEERHSPPPGVGPYKIAHIGPGRSFSLVKNPRWRRGEIPGIRPGHVNVVVRATGDAQSNALAVLDNRSDAFDSHDRLPPALLPRVHRQASARYSKQVVNASYLIFLNVTRKPFSSRLARIAVQTGLDDNTLRDLGADTLQEGCYLVPPDMPGHPHDQCPRGNIAQGGNVGQARALVARSGTAGARVTVWSPAGTPASSWMSYYASLLDRIGFRARLELTPPVSYYATIGRLNLHPQTGFGEFDADLPHPGDFYGRLTGPAVAATGNQNWGEIDDPHIDRQARILGVVPPTYLGAVAEFWHALERYSAGQAYFAVFGYRTVPVFVSERIDYPALVLSPVAGLDWSSFRLK